VNIYRIDGICAHTLRKLVIEECGNFKGKVITESKKDPTLIMSYDT
jgi:hypothetical protein